MNSVFLFSMRRTCFRVLEILISGLTAWIGRTTRCALPRCANCRRIGLGFVSSFVPDIVHAHDWHAALALAYMHYSNRRRPATVMTVHNLAYQGVFPPEMLAEIDLPPQSFTVRGVNIMEGSGS